MVGGFASHTPTGAAPLNPACFWIEDPNLNWLASESGSQKSLQSFTCIKIKYFKSVQIYMKDADERYFKFTFSGMCWNKWRKSIFEVLRFLVFEICTQYSQFSMNFHDNKKIKIGNLIFHSIQHCAHISWKWEQNWRGGGGGRGVHIISWICRLLYVRNKC